MKVSKKSKQSKRGKRVVWTVDLAGIGTIGTIIVSAVIMFGAPALPPTNGELVQDTYVTAAQHNVSEVQAA